MPLPHHPYEPSTPRFHHLPLSSRLMHSAGADGRIIMFGGPLPLGPYPVRSIYPMLARLRRHSGNVAFRHFPATADATLWLQQHPHMMAATYVFDEYGEGRGHFVVVAVRAPDLFSPEGWRPVLIETRAERDFPPHLAAIPFDGSAQVGNRTWSWNDFHLLVRDLVEHSSPSDVATAALRLAFAFVPAETTGWLSPAGFKQADARRALSALMRRRR